MRLVYTRAAARDLDDIIAHIAFENDAAASRVYEAISATADRLKDFPAMGHPGRLSGTRELSVLSLPYVIVYQHDADVVTILAIFHGARDLPRALAERRKILQDESRPKKR